MSNHRPPFPPYPPYPPGFPPHHVGAIDSYAPPGYGRAREAQPAFFTGIIRCRTCGVEVGRAEQVHASQAAEVAEQAPMNAFCPQGHVYNTNITLEWVPMQYAPPAPRPPAQYAPAPPVATAPAPAPAPAPVPVPAPAPASAPTSATSAEAVAKVVASANGNVEAPAIEAKADPADVEVEAAVAETIAAAHVSEGLPPPVVTAAEPRKRVVIRNGTAKTEA